MTEEIATTEAPATEVVEDGIGVEAPAQAPAAEGTAPQTAPQTEADEAGIGAEPEQQAAPAAAEYTTDGIELPEGMELDTKAVGQLADVCRELKVSPEAFRTITAKMTPVLAARQAEQLGEVRKAFLAQGRADKEMGGVNWAATKATAGKAFAKFVDPQTRSLFVKLGLDCHPGVIRAFKRIQESVSDDVVVRGETAAQRDVLKNFYDHSDMN